MLEFNVRHGFLFFRITSDLVPFASHPVCTYAWPEAIAGTFRSIGVFLRKHDLRVYLHPDQFILAINAKDPGIVMRSVAESRYQAEILDLLETDAMEKIQIYVGGLCGEREKSLAWFVERYEALPGSIRWLSGAFNAPCVPWPFWKHFDPCRETYQRSTPEDRTAFSLFGRQQPLTFRRVKKG